jgi:HK97 family phage major capsid protein
MPTPEPTLLDQLRTLRATKVEEWGTMIDARETERAEFEARRATEADKITDDDVEAYRKAETDFKSAVDLHEAGIVELDERIRQHEEIVARRAAAASEHKGNIVLVSEPMTYRPDPEYKDGSGKSVSYFRDLAAMFHPLAQSRLHDVSGARDRLTRHAKEIEVELPKRAADREARAQRQVDEAEREFTGSFVGSRSQGMQTNPFEKRVNPNRTDGQGGYFVPPLWLVDEYIGGLRAGRITAGLCRQMDLPEGTDSINIPKLATLTQVGVQGADGGAVTSVDYTDTAVTANVKTLAGQEDVAIQLIEQSPGQIVDRVIMEDLLSDYNRLVDRQVVYGNGTNSAALNGGQLLGVYPSTNWSGTNVITATEGTPNGQYFPQVTGAMASNIAWNRYDLSNLNYVMHPRRWFWYATTLDSTGRPLVEASDFSPFNPGAINVGDVPAEGLAGKLPFGPNAYIDANVPTTDNGSGVLTGTNDVVLGAKWDDAWLFEGDMRVRVLPEILSGTLELRYQVYNYVAFLVRYGQSLAVAQGTYLAAPTGSTVTSITF